MDRGCRRWTGYGHAAVALAAILTLASCANGATTTTAPTAPTRAAAPMGAEHQWDTTGLPDPCRLLTTREVAAQVGHPVGNAKRVTGWPPSCQFLLDKRTELRLNIVSDARPDAVWSFERRKTIGEPLQRVTGIGDDAYWLPGSALHVRSGRIHLYLVLRGGADLPRDARDQAIALARIALPRALRASTTQ